MTATSPAPSHLSALIATEEEGSHPVDFLPHPDDVFGLGTPVKPSSINRLKEVEVVDDDASVSDGGSVYSVHLRCGRSPVDLGPGSESEDGADFSDGGCSVEDEEEFWANFEDSAGVKSAVRQRSGLKRRERALNQVDHVEEAVGRALAHRDALHKDYMEVLLLLLVWGLAIMGAVQITRHKRAADLLLMPILVALSIPTCIVLAMYWHETSALASRLTRVMERRKVMMRQKFPGLAR
ncbi:unnamed protein product [Chrysoparadoxa australica]